MRQFAEQEIVLPTGPHAGLRFRISRQPIAGLLFDEIDSGRWERVATTGPRQSGKSLKGFIIPTLFHLFEMRETVIFGTPTGEMASDKWNRDLLPAIKATRYRDLLPRSGAGSKGGKVETIEFGNGAVLKFMTGGGSDKKRAAFTTRVLAVTETDGMDEAGEASREADKITQMEGCTRAFGDLARIYLECTVSIESGRIWQEIKNGSDSRIILPCPHCGHHVTPEREHLVGWQDAEDVLTAGERTRIVCPECGEMWDENDRARANRGCRLVHKGQEVTPDGTITGQPARTRTLGFRYTAINNLLVPLRVLGMDEWRAARSGDEENADKEQRQYVWAVPAKATSVDLTEFDAAAITRRTTTDMRGRVPTHCNRVTVGIDVGKRLCNWSAIAWGAHATPHVLEYGRIEVPSDQMAVERAILTALRDFRDSVLMTGWPADGGNRVPHYVFIDCGNWQDDIRAFVAESGTQKIWPVKGFSRLEEKADRKRQGGTIKVKGRDSVVVDLEDRLPFIVEANANAWKSWLHARLQTPMGQPGAMTLYNVPKAIEHNGFAKHLTAERKVEEFVAGKGLETRWEQKHRNNHWLDSTCLACLAGWWAGERVIGETVTAPAPAQSAPAPKASYGPQKRWST